MQHVLLKRRPSCLLLKLQHTLHHSIARTPTRSFYTAVASTSQLVVISESLEHPDRISILPRAELDQNLGLYSQPELDKHLGLNQNLDRDPLGSTQPPKPPKWDNGKGKEKQNEEISDREWDIRTGRATYILTQTLPEFFSLGLVTSSNASSTTDSISRSEKRFPRISFIPNTRHSGKDKEEEDGAEPESIYSPKVRLKYTPPVRLPSPFPGTFTVEGLPLYMASSVFIRHTLKTLYSDLRVEIRRVSIQKPKTKPSPDSQTSGWSDTDRDRERQLDLGANKSSLALREKSLFVGLCVRGTARVSGSENEWEVNSTYTFSPSTGLIHIHTIDSIYPAPHQAAYDALRMSLGRMMGFAGAVPGEVTRTQKGELVSAEGGQIVGGIKS